MSVVDGLAIRIVSLWFAMVIAFAAMRFGEEIVAGMWQQMQPIHLFFMTWLGVAVYFVMVTVLLGLWG